MANSKVSEQKSLEYSQHEQEIAIQRQNDRKSKVKRKKERTKKLEDDRLAQERTESEIVGPEMLKLSVDTNIVNAETEDKKYAKMKRKYEKKLAASLAEIDDLHEV